jgi:Methylamine utilization protein MauJ
MTTEVPTPRGRLAIVDPSDPAPGVIGVAVPEERLAELQAAEQARTKQVWRVRGVVSDHIPLAGDVRGVIGSERTHNFFLNDKSLAIYLHRGGHDAIFFDLVAQPGGRLDYIEVKVETDLPSNALLFARQPLNEMLDALVRTPPNPPLLLQRLELVSPIDDGILAYEVTLPFNQGVLFGPMGGVLQWRAFAPYFAIFREAITTSSPFYRLLCAWRVYEGIQTIRQWLREQCTRFDIKEKLPKEPEVDTAHLQRMGFSAEFCAKIRRISDLFNELRELRTGIAHFLFEGEAGDAHVYLARGHEIRNYSVSSAILLSYANRGIDDLRIFYTNHVEPKLGGSQIMPMEDQKDQFIVKVPVEGEHARFHFRYDFIVKETEVKVVRDGQPLNVSFYTTERDTKDSASALHKFLESIGRSRVDAHAVCEAVERGQSAFGVIGNK